MQQPIDDDCPANLRDLIESCWQAAPEARPDFETITSAALIETIIIDSIIKDETGREFWKDKFLEQVIHHR